MSNKIHEEQFREIFISLERLSAVPAISKSWKKKNEKTKLCEVKEL